MSGIVNKVKEALHHDKSTHEQPTGTHGPHDSRAANAADPRIDSDRDHRAHPTTTHGEGIHSSRPHEGVGSTGLGSGGAYGHEQPSGTHGPHSSRTANVADPRIDSDNDHRGAPGATGFGSSTTHNTHTGGLGSSGAHNTHTSGAPEGVHGPHGSRVANAADPRVDSDRDHRGAPGTTGFGSSATHNTHAGGVGSTGNYGSSTTHGTHGTSALGSTGGAYGSGAPEGTHGPHGSRVANAADPRIDSDRDHRGAPGSNLNGPASNTAGPHKSDALNKVDPRVDSDLDGSKTYGGNKTHQY